MNLKSPSRSKCLDPGRVFCKAVTWKVKTFSWWPKWQWLGHRIVCCKMVNLMLSGFHLNFWKMTFAQLWWYTVDSRGLKETWPDKWSFAVALIHWVKVLGFPRGTKSHPKGMLAFVLGEPSPPVRLSSLCPSQKMQSEGIRWQEHFLFISTNCSFPEWPTDEWSSGLASEACSK